MYGGGTCIKRTPCIKRTLARVQGFPLNTGFTESQLPLFEIGGGGAVYLGMYWVLENKIGGTLQYPPCSKYRVSI